MPAPFHWLELQAFCQATEDDERVTRALTFLLPDVAVATRSTQGHWGNRLALLTARTKEDSSIDAFWRRLGDAGCVGQIRASLPDRLDKEGVLHVRLDKQAAYLGTVKTVRGDDTVTVRAKVAAPRARRGDLLKAARSYLEAL